MGLSGNKLHLESLLFPVRFAQRVLPLPVELSDARGWITAVRAALLAHMVGVAAAAAARYVRDLVVFSEGWGSF